MHHLRFIFRILSSILMTSFVVSFFIYLFFPRQALYDHGLDARSTRQDPMLRHLSIGSIGFHFSVADSRASRSTLSAKRPTGAPFPCRYHTAWVHLQRRLPGTFYIDFHSRFADKSTLSLPLLTGPGATVAPADSAPLHRPQQQSRAVRSTFPLPPLNGPGAAISAHQSGSFILAATASALTGVPFPCC